MSGRLLSLLPIDIEEHIIGLLCLNEVACTIRLVNKAAAAHYPGPEHPRPTVRLSQPVPHHAFARRCEASSGAWVKAMTYKQRRKLLCLTAASGDLVNLELAVRVAGCVLRGAVMDAAAAAGHVHVCQWLRQRGCRWGSALASAAGAGRREACEWLLAGGCPGKPEYLRDAACAAARGGHLAVAEWLWQQLPPEQVAAHGHDLVVAVAHGGDLTTLQRYYSAWRDARQQQAQGQEGAHAGGHQQQQQQQLVEEEEEAEAAAEEEEEEELKAEVLASACSGTTPDWGEKVAWLEAQGCARSAFAGAAAARMPGQAAVDRLRWLRERGYPLREEEVHEAAKGNVAAFEFLLEEAGEGNEGFPPFRELDKVAAHAGNLAALQRHHASGRPVNAPRCLSAAAWTGHLAVVSWLVDTFGLTAGDLLEHAVVPAIGSGSMELVDWLVGRGCIVTLEDDVLTQAAEAGCEVMLERLVQMGCYMPIDGRPYFRGIRNGDLATLRCLARLGSPWGPTDLATTPLLWSHTPLPVMRCLVEVGCPIDWSMALVKARAVLSGEKKSEAVAWMKEGLRRSQGM